ncbi:MAG TPA: protein TolR [Rhodospirillaceae bacterium]|nr:protein TolR [Alphaproteobacteria bacterium]OUT39606.1 MAG: protein TolR [Micavibrio sp. TMED2]HCI47777.1 protein TolR [Rhodospirillaceae bacterium]MAS48998.1 protein TolR [Alphaproteobacteria bacterium]MAX97400.1 protein TolR [Alphaproteobacteria bacterium]|tara:strand:+ start:1551 stop:1985 length:435 start_codon:yes stop_codon:yes gene_type:complete
MGVSLKQSGSRRGGRRAYTPMAEINVTPFVDVMLVLLIVFMVSAPLLTVGVPVELPQSQASALNDPEEPVVVTVDAEGQIFVQETVVELDRVTPLLRAVTQNNPDIRIFVRGDRQLAYGDIMQVMGVINSAGFRRVALITETPK